MIGNIPFEDLFLLVSVEWPVVVHVVPDVPGQVIGLVLHQTDGRQDGHDQLLILLLQTLCTQTTFNI